MIRSVMPLLLRRMRVPLAVLIGVYGVAVLGFTLMPGVDDQGNVWYMSIFQAFYVVSYTGSTIGFGEVPYPFSDAQRLWTMASIYMTVFAWLYSVGTIISLLQDTGFRQALLMARLQRSMSSFNEPFYIICGYGDTGRLLARSLLNRGRRVVIVDKDPHNVEDLRTRDLGVYVPAFCMDAEIPDNLLMAGLQHRWCAGVLAVTDDDHANLKVAITVKLLNSRTKVFCRADALATVDNMLSFGTDLVVNPYQDFAHRLLMGIFEPDSHRVYDWLTSLPDYPLPERPVPPEGRWIICGYGRFGRAVYRALTARGIEVTLVVENAQQKGCPPGTIEGKGTEAVTLREAGIETASALVAGTEDDADNLSIIMTARALNPDIYQVAQENRLHNHALFQAANVALAVQTSYIIASRFLSVLGASLLKEFLDLAGEQGNEWNRALALRMRQGCDALTPESWSLRVSRNRAPAVALALELGETITLETLCRDPRNREQCLDTIALLLEREGEKQLLPAPGTALKLGDRVLFCGTERALDLMSWNASHLSVLRYVHNGEQHPDGWIWRRMAKRRRERAVVVPQVDKTTV